MEILEVKNTIANFKNAMNRLDGKMEGTEDRISELEYGTEMIQPEQVKENEQENEHVYMCVFSFMLRRLALSYLSF